jgi:hypothetical protein
MVRKIALAFAVSIGLLGVSGARASAQEVVVGVAPPYVVVPPAYVEIGPPPGRGYYWVPRYRRWEFRHFDRDDYRRFDRDYDRHFDRHEGRPYFRRDWR